jgi:hypothetical protein
MLILEIASGILLAVFLVILFSGWADTQERYRRIDAKWRNRS